MALHTIASESELDELIASSKDRPVLIFKYSNACPISSRASSQVARYLDAHPNPAFGFGMVVVQDARALSDTIEERLGIRHETPQVIVLRGGRAVWHASHFDVTEGKLKLALEGL